MTSPKKKPAFTKSWNDWFIVDLHCTHCRKVTNFTVKEPTSENLICPGCYKKGNFSLNAEEH